MAKRISAELARYRPTIQRWIADSTAASITRIVTQNYITETVDLSGYLTITAGDARYYPRPMVDQLIEDLDIHDQVHDITGPDHTAVGALAGQVVQSEGGIVKLEDGANFELESGLFLEWENPTLHWDYLSHQSLVDIAEDDHHNPVTQGSGILVGAPGEDAQHVQVASDVARKNIDNQFTTDQNVTGDVIASNSLQAGNDVIATDEGRFGGGVTAGSTNSPGAALDVQGTSLFTDDMTLWDGLGYITDHGITSDDFGSTDGTDGIDLRGFDFPWTGELKARSLYAPTIATVTLQKQRVAVIGNTMLVASGAALREPFTVPNVVGATGTFTVRDPESEHAIQFLEGEHVRIKTNATGSTPSQTNAGYPTLGPMMYMFPVGVQPNIDTPLDTWYTILEITDNQDDYSYQVRLEYISHPISTRCIGRYDFRVDTQAEALENLADGSNPLSIVLNYPVLGLEDGVPFELEDGGFLTTEESSAEDLTFDDDGGLVFSNNLALDTGIVAHENMTAIVKLNSWTHDSGPGVRPFGVRSGLSSSTDFGVWSSSTSNNVIVSNGSTYTFALGAAPYDGVIAVIGPDNYGAGTTRTAHSFNGVDDDGDTIYIGANNDDGEPGALISATIEWMMIFDGVLTAEEYASVVNGMEWQTSGDTLTDVTSGPFQYPINETVASYGADDDGRLVLDSRDISGYSALYVFSTGRAPWLGTSNVLTLGEFLNAQTGVVERGLRIADDPDNDLDGELVMTNTTRSFNNMPSTWGRDEETTSLSADGGLVFNREILTDNPYLWIANTRTDRNDANSDYTPLISAGMESYTGLYEQIELQTTLRSHWHDEITLRDSDGDFNGEMQPGSRLLVRADGKTENQLDEDGDSVRAMVGVPADLVLEGGSHDSLASMIADYIHLRAGPNGSFTVSGAKTVQMSARSKLSLAASEFIQLLADDVRLVGLPTSAPSESDRLWNDSGTIKIT